MDADDYSEGSDLEECMDEEYTDEEYTGGYDSPVRCDEVASITLDELRNASCRYCADGAGSLKALQDGYKNGCAKCSLHWLAVLKVMKWEDWEIYCRDIDRGDHGMSKGESYIEKVNSGI